MTGFPLSGRSYPPLVLAAHPAWDTRFVHSAIDQKLPRNRRPHPYPLGATAGRR
jgi:hypothetical protein